jgi:hypothetical protein
MRLRWTTPATQDPYNIIRHIQRGNPNAAAKVAETLSMWGVAGCWISLVRAAEGGSQGPENWCSQVCLTLWFIAFKIRIWRLCASIMERKTGRKGAYRQLIKQADARFDRHLAFLKAEASRQKGATQQ